MSKKKIIKVVSIVFLVLVGFLICIEIFVFFMTHHLKLSEINVKNIFCKNCCEQINLAECVLNPFCQHEPTNYGWHSIDICCRKGLTYDECINVQPAKAVDYSANKNEVFIEEIKRNKKSDFSPEELQIREIFKKNNLNLDNYGGYAYKTRNNKEGNWDYSIMANFVYKEITIALESVIYFFDKSDRLVNSFGNDYILSYFKDLQITEPKIDLNKLTEIIKKKEYRNTDLNLKAELVWWNRNISTGNHTPDMVLAWSVTGSAESGFYFLGYYVDANSGEILYKDNGIRY